MYFHPPTQWGESVHCITFMELQFLMLLRDHYYWKWWVLHQFCCANSNFSHLLFCTKNHNSKKHNFPLCSAKLYCRCLLQVDKFFSTTQIPASWWILRKRFLFNLVRRKQLSLLLLARIKTLINLLPQIFYKRNLALVFAIQSEWRHDDDDDYDEVDYVDEAQEMIITWLWY